MVIIVNIIHIIKKVIIHIIAVVHDIIVAIHIIINIIAILSIINNVIAARFAVFPACYFCSLSKKNKI